MEPDRDARREMREDGLSLTITSLAAVATAWSAFQASTWSGVQTFALANAARLRELSTQLRLEGDQQMHVDADLFIAYAGALVEHRDAFATFLRARFPPRLQVATDEWLDTHPLEATSAPAHPLAMPEYRVEAMERANVAQKASDEASDHAARANHAADLYVLATVLLATIITMSSLGSRLSTRSARRASLVFCGVVLLVVIVWLALRPVAWVGPGA
jgi:hypothetical protein